MGLFDLFKKKKEEAPTPHTEHVQQPGDYDDFYFKHEKKLDKWEERIEDTITYDDNPEKTIASFEKALSLCDEFEAFCMSDPEGGVEYFQKDGAEIRQRIQSDYDDYMKNEYEEDLKDWNEYQEEEKLKKSVRSKLLSSVKREGKIAQADLKKLLSEEEVPLYSSSVKALEESGKIVRAKEGNKIYFSLGR